MLEQLYTSSKAVSVESGGYFMAYVQAWDALALSSSARLDKIFRDGSQFKIGLGGASNLGSRVAGKIFWGVSNDNSPFRLYSADDITGQPNFGDLLNPDWQIPITTCGHGDFLDDQAGYYLHCAAGVEIYRLADGLHLGDLLDRFGPSGLAYAGLNQVLAFRGADGTVALINYVTQTIVWQSTVRPFSLAAYDCLHDLILTVEGDGLVRVYLTTPAPASLSNPVFTPSTVRCLNGHQVSVRLTGDQGEPCGGYVVDWALADAQGWIEKPQSQTDAEGYAANYYFGPRTGSGSETLQAQVAL